MHTEQLTRSDRPAILEAPISTKAEAKEQIYLFLSQTYSEAALGGEHQLKLLFYRIFLLVGIGKKIPHSEILTIQGKRGRHSGRDAVQECA